MRGECVCHSLSSFGSCCEKKLQEGVLVTLSISEFHFLVLCVASVWQLCKQPVHASVCQSDACGRISSEKFHPQGLCGLRSNILSPGLVVGKVNANFDSSSLISRRSRKSMATRGAFN